MRGEALPKETHPEPPHAGQHPQAPFGLMLFASILLRRPFDALDEDDATIVGWAAEEAARWHRNGRADGTSDVLAFRIVYRALREQAADAPPLELAERGPRWEKVLRATCMLRHRQRAVLAACYCAGMEVADAGRVVRASEAQARAVIASAVSGVAKVLGEPVDVRRSLRMAAGRLAARAAAAAEERQPEPVAARAEPRAVMRNWVTPSWPLDGTAALQPMVDLGVVRTLLGPVGTASAAPDRESAPAPPAVPARPAAPARDIVPVVRRKLDRRPLFAAAAALLILAMLVPGVAVEPSAEPSVRPAAAQAQPVAVRERAPVVEVAAPLASLAPRAVRVRRGDSLWALATVHLGDGARWRAIWRLNRGEVMVSGHRFTQPGLIRPGWVLRLPERARV